MPDKSFPTTSWTIIQRAGAPLSPDGRKALGILCERYWFPVHAFIRRYRGSADEASDRTQDFFTSLLARNDFAKLDRTRGSKFRSWLLACVRNYLANQYGKGPSPVQFVSVDAVAAEGRYQAELTDHLTPERLYERQFALTFLAHVREELRAKYARAGKEQRFEALEGCLSEHIAQRPYEEVAAILGKEVGAVKRAAFDLRERYKDQLLAEMADLLPDTADADEVKAELRHLLAAFDN